LIEEWMENHFGPRAIVGRAVEDLTQGLRRLPRLIDNLHLVTENERRKAEGQAFHPPPPTTIRARPRIGFAEIIAVVALIVAIVALLL
jgi:ubiquinone biosynthesis protein